jgi:predicted RNA-binding Zn ribbon-like protein
MDVAELARQIEYKVAPEPLIAVQGLANTFAFEPEEERLIDAASARRWMVESDLAVSGVEVGNAELGRLVTFREVIRDLLEANLTGEPDRATSANLARVVADHQVRLAATDGTLSVELGPAASVDELISQLCGIVLQAQLVGQWPRLKICASDECRWAFYDSSRNRGGTWCQMETCGNQVKNRAYRRRKAAGEARAEA